MAMMSQTAFGITLAAVRKRQGFDSPFAFYRGRGGQRALGLSFSNYLRLERGKGLPKGWRLERILAALGLESSSPAAQELVRAYVKDALGSERLLACLDGAPGHDPAPPSWLAVETAARQAIGQRAVQLTLDQFRVLALDRPHYLCHAVLANTSAWMEKGELASLTGLSPAAVDRAVAALKTAGLARVSGRRVRSPLAGRYVTPPTLTPALSGVFAAFRKHREAWIRERGRLVHAPYLILRARRGAFGRYLPHLSDVVALSAIYGDVHPAEDSAMYIVDASVFRLT